jgi:hypothetical protein
MQAYQYTDEDIEKITGVMAPDLIEKNHRVYRVTFSTGEHERVIIELLFDSRKKLRFMSIDAYGF